MKQGVNSLRHLLVVLLMVMAVGTAVGETHYKPKLWMGAKAGASLGRMSFSPHVKQLWQPGGTASLTFRYAEENLFGLVAELGVAQRGWRENYEKAPLEYSRTLTYVQLPVLTHIYFGTRRFKGFVNLGPEFAVLIGSSISSNFDYHNPRANASSPRNRRTEQLVQEITGKFDYGITAGLGIEYYVHPRHSLVLEGRYYYGLGNIFPASKADTFGASRNMSIEVTIGYNFRLQ